MDWRSPLCSSCVSYWLWLMKGSMTSLWVIADIHHTWKGKWYQAEVGRKALVFLWDRSEIEIEQSLCMRCMSWLNIHTTTFSMARLLCPRQMRSWSLSRASCSILLLHSWCCSNTFSSEAYQIRIWRSQPSCSWSLGAFSSNHPPTAMKSCR